MYCLELKSRAHNLKQLESGGSVHNQHARLHEGGGVLREARDRTEAGFEFNKEHVC